MTLPHRINWQRRPVALDALQAVQDAAGPGFDDAVDHPLAARRYMVARHWAVTSVVTAVAVGLCAACCTSTQRRLWGSTTTSASPGARRRGVPGVGQAAAAGGPRARERA